MLAMCSKQHGLVFVVELYSRNSSLCFGVIENKITELCISSLSFLKIPPQPQLKCFSIYSKALVLARRATDPGSMAQAQYGQKQGGAALSKLCHVNSAS